MISQKDALLTNEEKELLLLIAKASKLFSWEIKNQILKNIKIRKRKEQKQKKYLKKSKIKRDKERMRIQYIPLLVSQAILKGIPLREPKMKKDARAEPEPLLYNQMEKFQPTKEFTDFIKKANQTSNEIEEINFESLAYIPDRIYLQRINEKNENLLVKMFVDWGYISESKLELFIDDNKNEKAFCVIRVIDKQDKLVGCFQLKHRSFFVIDEEPTAESLFIGLITGLKPNTKYKYRIECYKKSCETLFAATAFKEFRTSFNLSEQNKALFFTVSSDLHGGRNGRFLRGNLKKRNVSGNFDLEKVFNSIATTEKFVTFDEGYSLSIVTGDLTENASYSEYWADLFKRCKSVWDHVPLLTCIGNHDYYSGGRGKGNILGGSEEDCRFWHRFITSPSTGGGVLPGHWYSIDQGNAHLVFIDSNGTGWGKYKIDCTSQQWYWLENDLRTWREKLENGEKAPQFCFVFLHSAIMSSGFWGRGFNWGNDEKAQSYLTPLFRKYGITMAIFGHDHIYQRSKWMGTNYLVNGRNGGTLRPDLLFLRSRLSFDIYRTCSNQHTRIYTTLYIPPNIDYFSSDEKESFSKFKQSIREQLLKQPTSSFYFFGVRLINLRLGRLFDNNINLKKELLDNFVLPKLENHIWLRAYAVEPIYSIKKREIFDMCFIKMKSSEELQEENYQINCPEKVVD